jgi:lipopolysaccharide transport system ATP-binding protein
VSEAVIQVRGLGKEYKLGARREPYRTLRETLSAAFIAPLRRKAAGDAAANNARFAALREVSFDVHAGDVLGVVGRNGAGKSTLLKILSRITAPSAGRVSITGRVASLLEVGTGFHPELTGRENIFLNGAILGMTREEIRRRFDEIVAFAEVERFLDTPVKRYSSGMYVRLAFSVAAFLEPEILLVDEVLAVGDLEFQRRCIGRMEQVGKTGRTVLFVSHNLAMVERLCTRAIMFKAGRLDALGTPSEIVGRYIQEAGGSSADWTHPGPLPAHPHFVRARLCRPDGAHAGEFGSDGQVAVEFTMSVPPAVPPLLVAVAVKNSAGQWLFSSSPLDCGLTVPDRPGEHTLRVAFPPAFFMPKSFSITLSLYSQYEAFHQVEDGITLGIVERPSLANLIPGGRVGDLQVLCTWQIL